MKAGIRSTGNMLIDTAGMPPASIATQIGSCRLTPPNEKVQRHSTDASRKHPGITKLPTRNGVTLQRLVQRARALRSKILLLHKIQSTQPVLSSLLIDLPPPLCKEFLHLPTHRITACLLNEK